MRPTIPWILSRILRLLVAATLLLAATAAFAIHCNPECEPDPSDPTYSGTFTAAQQSWNARLDSRPLHPHDPPLPGGKGGAQITPASASFNYVAPILHLPGRAGLDVNLNLYYNSRIWIIDTVNNTATFNADRDFPAYGFRLGFGYIESNSGSYVLHEGDGTIRSFIKGTAPYYQTTDSSYIDWNSSTLVLRYKNGTKVQYAAFPGSTSFLHPTRITDTNGNYISIAYRTDSWAKGQEISTITDTLGRVITFNYNTTGALTGTLASIAQGSKTYAAFSWSSTYVLNYSFASPLVPVNSPSNGSTQIVLTGMIYGNSLAVNFTYGDWGMVNQIQQLSATGAIRSSLSYDTVTAGTPATDFPGFSHQTVFDGVNTAIYTHTIGKSGGAVSTYTIQNPAPSSTQTLMTLFTTGDWKQGLTQSVQFQNSNGTPLRTTTYTYAADSSTNYNPRPSEIVTQLNDSNKLAKVDYSYDSYGNVTRLDEYDWGLNNVRSTLTSYLSSSSYVNNHILNRVSMIEIATGLTLTSRTDIAYDSTALASLPGATQHDDSNYGSNNTVRGNPTSITRYTAVTWTSATGPIVRNLSYNTLGDLLSADADCCKTIQWAYSNATQYAYPDSVTRGPSGTQLTTSTVYNLTTGLPASMTDENGQTTSFTYDVTDRPASATRPDGVVVTNTYDDSSISPSMAISSTANGTISKATFDGAGRLLQQETDNGFTQISIVQTEYDAAGRVSQSSNPYKPGDTQVWNLYGYDNYDRLVTVTPNSGGGYQRSYYGNSATSTDPAGKQRRSFTDALGRLIEVDEPGAGDGMSSTGFVTIVGQGQTVTITVNGLAKSGLGPTNASSMATSIARLFNNDATSSVSASAVGSTVYFTSKNAAANTNYSLSATATSGFTLYLSGSTLTGGADPSGNSTLATPMITTYTYDALNDLLTVSQEKRGSLPPQSRSYAYDALGRLTSSSPAEATAATTYTYTDFGAPLLRTDPRGVKTTYTYDAMNRPNQISYDVSSSPGVAATSQINYTYGTSSASNNNGRLITAANGNESDIYQYDLLGRVTSVAKTIVGIPNSYPIAYGYNGVGELTTLTYPSGRVVTNSYDAIGRLQQIADSSRTYLTIPDTAADYTAAGQVTQFNYGNGVIGYLGYNDHMQIASIRYVNGTNDLLNLAYCYTTTSTPGTCYSATPQAGNNGQIQKITFQPNGVEDTTKSQNYQYDAVYRLIQASTSDQTQNGTWTMSWNYDRFGNMLQQNVTAGQINPPYTAPSQPQLTVSSTTNRIMNAGYQYDNGANGPGNLTSDGSNSYTYDAENRLVTFSNGSTSASYAYGVNGLRIQKTVGTNVTTYIFSRANVIAEYSGSTPTLSQEYVYSGGSLFASINAATGAISYRHLDHLSARVETDANGCLSRTFGHYPYGEPWYESVSSNPPNPCNGQSDKWKFTSYERDSESSLDYAKARSDVPRLGRFLTCDPLGGSISDPQSLNRYTYVLSDPIDGVDPLGLDTCKFNVELFNAAGLGPSEIAQIESRINAIYSGVASPNGDTVGINFVVTGTPDSSITIYPSSSWLTETLTGGASGMSDFLRSPRVYLNHIGDNQSTTNIGGASAHELAHQLGGGMLGGFGDMLGLQNEYDPKNPNIMMWDSAPDNAKTSAWEHSDNPLWSFTPQQIAKLYDKCKKDHPTASGGGGGFNGWNTPGGGGGSGAVCYFDVEWVPDCSGGDGCPFVRVVTPMCNQ